MRHGSQIDPPNRFEKIHSVPDYEHLEWDTESLQAQANRRIEYVFDRSKTIISENQSPDLPFRYSLNPYRGCIHGCSYCYARPGHEYLGMNAGLDFETKVVVKPEAPKLFRQFLARKTWQPEVITFSGVTDCYQPAEREFQLTRQCLQVALECCQPVGIVTKNALILRDLEILKELASRSLVRVFISVTTLDPQLALDMEPRTSIPFARLRAVEMLANAGVPVGLMTAPVIPGLNDSELPRILNAASDAGAMTAHYTLLRLPLTVEPVFEEWLERTQPERKERVLSRIRQTRDGSLSDSQFGSRMRGTGEIADQIQGLFQVARRKCELDRQLPPLDFSQFQRPDPNPDQLRLF
ncbi:MAG: PA0069 family radical SAM protein [Planctomycetaceae bacterium]